MPRQAARLRQMATEGAVMGFTSLARCAFVGSLSVVLARSQPCDQGQWYPGREISGTASMAHPSDAVKNTRRSVGADLTGQSAGQSADTLHGDITTHGH